MNGSLPERRGSYVAAPLSTSEGDDIWKPARTLRADSESTLLLSTGRESRVEAEEENGAYQKSPISPALVLEEASTSTLHLGDLDSFQMDEAYIRECCARMGWEGVTQIKLIRGTS